ncbi:MAG: hypothetical protein R2940_18190 [Syntrophotaleaceae bacterium]
MEQINRYGLLRLQYLKAFQPQLLSDLNNRQCLEDHLLDFQRQMEMEVGQLVFAGLEDEEAERYVIEEYLVGKGASAQHPPLMNQSNQNLG